MIGDRLDQIGDRQPGVGLDGKGVPDIVWCDVPGGAVPLEGETGSFDVSPFHMAKYPVTYVQYKAFLDAPDGYGNERHWKDLKRQNTPGEQFRVAGSHPADNVSWYDAVAFCRWLSGHLGFEVRLPLEWEWQQAATGGRPANVYPWGLAWNGACANTYECRLNGTTAVGMYPAGRSAQGVMDLAGTLWEWCLSSREAPRNMDIKRSDARVLRGGSWISYQVNARAASRYASDPDNRSGGIGFRLVCVSPIS